MFSVNGTNISLSKGDTGALKFTATATRMDTGTAYTFGENDRAVLTIRQGNNILKEKAYVMTNNQFTVYFFNRDTDKLPTGNYQWDVRYVINAYFDEEDPTRVVDGDQVITPNGPMSMNLLTVVGDI